MRPPSAADPGKPRAAQRSSRSAPEHAFNFWGLQVTVGTQDIVKQPALIRCRAWAFGGAV